MAGGMQLQVLPGEKWQKTKSVLEATPSLSGPPPHYPWTCPAPPHPVLRTGPSPGAPWGPLTVSSWNKNQFKQDTRDHR